MQNVFTCLNCGKVNILSKNTFGKYCNLSCQHEHRYKTKVKDWLEGKEQGWTGKAVNLKPFVKRYLFETRGTACEECGWDKRHPDGSILTEIDHIDGDASNCVPKNLRILCPNCHALTPTFRRRNKNSVRNREQTVITAGNWSKTIFS